MDYTGIKPVFPFWESTV